MHDDYIEAMLLMALFFGVSTLLIVRMILFEVL